MLLSFLSFLSLHSRPDKVAERTAELGRAGHHPCLSPAIHRIHRIDLLRPASQSHGLGRRSGELQHAGAHRAVSKEARPRHGHTAWLWHSEGPPPATIYQSGRRRTPSHLYIAIP